MVLQDLIPKSCSFKLKTLDERLTLNPITLADEIWLSEKYGVDCLTKIFTDVNFVEIVNIVYRLLSVDSKSKLQKQRVEFYDEEGNKSYHELGGVKLLYSMISGNKEKEEVMVSLLETIGFSKQITEEIESNKKKVQ